MARYAKYTIGQRPLKTRSTEMAKYREWLVVAEQKSQENFDKTVLTLSGGALGISFAFLKDIVGPQPIILSVFLLTAWFAWEIGRAHV